MQVKQRYMLGRELGGVPRTVGGCMSADGYKQHNCDHKVIARSFKPEPRNLQIEAH